MVRLTAAVLGVFFCAAAQDRRSVDDVAALVRSAIRLKQPDGQVAKSLRKVKLSQRLDDRTIEALESEGAGPKAAAALRQLRDTSRALPKPLAPRPADGPPPPSVEEQSRVLEEAREIALNYTKSLPDFICTEAIKRYFDPSGKESWQASDTLTVKLSYFRQKENYELTMINSRPTNRSYESVGGALSKGEFGSMLGEVFERSSAAEFQWDHWTTLRKRPAHVYLYRIPRATSHYVLDFSISGEKRQRAVAGERGAVYIDRETNQVVRITGEADDVPPGFPLRQATTELDYNFVDVGGHEFLLPLRAEVRLQAGSYQSKNEVEFHGYRKFHSETTINFDRVRDP